MYFNRGVLEKGFIYYPEKTTRELWWNKNMMIPVFKCEECETEMFVDIYTESQKGISKNFIDMICCPICNSTNMRVCFVKRINNEPQLKTEDLFIPESLLNYYDQLNSIEEH